MQQSRTYTITMTAISAISLLGLSLILLMGLMAWLAPEQLPDVIGAIEVYSTFALSLAGLGGVGAGAMAHRDAASGGLTSSQGSLVAAAAKMKERAGG